MGSDAERLHLINHDPDKTTADIRNRPFTGVAHTHALYVQQAGTSGAGQALVIESKNAAAPAFTVSSPVGGEGLRLNGALVVSAVPGAPAPSTLPLGGTSAARNTGIQLISSFDGGEDNSSGTDSTARINIYSYQRAATHSFGEVQRMYAMRRDSKQMIAWYGWVNPDKTPGYDPVTRDVAPGASCKPIAWIGAHIEANDHASMHNHISIEVPDTTGALQTRFEILLGDRATGKIGLDKTFIITNDADFAVRQSGGESFRVVAPSGTEKRIEFMGDAFGTDSSRRWKLRSTSTAESGLDAGSDFEIVRYNDSGVAQSATFIVRRSSGLVGFGTAVSDIDSRITVRQDGTASAGKFVSTTEGTASTATLRVETPTAAKRGLDYRITGDAVSRVRMDASVSGSGTITFGDGATADTNLFRSAANTLRTDDSFVVGTNLTVSGTTTATGRILGPTGYAYGTIAPSRTDPAWRVPSVSHQFQSGHSWTASGAASSNLNKTLEFVRGTQCASITTNGSGTPANLRLFGGPSLNLTGKMIRLIARISDVSRVSDLSFFVGTSSLANNFKWRAWQVTGSSQLSSNNEWFTLTLDWGSINAAAGSFSISSAGVPSTTTGFTDLQVQITDTSTGALTLDVQAVEVIDATSETFPGGVVSVVFDDSDESVYDLARPKMDALGFAGTQYTIVGNLGTAGYLTTAELRQLQDFSGWEIGLHSYSSSVHNSRYTSFTAADVDDDLRSGKQWLVSNGFRGEGVAYPGGEYQRTTDGVGIDAIASRYFSHGRTILWQSGRVTETFTPANSFRLRAISSVSDTQSGANKPSSMVAAGGLLDKCAGNGGWLILVFHKITSGAATVSTECSQSDFNSIMDAISSKGITVLPVSEVLRHYS
ncbi:polysaccharide deacetylase family protein [Streptomyces sp. VNUA74]|uniref:polysaccharide deacetylase family protein n=1 Tax=Streptomyces sp. VNUA74 TaxID=3062685 RepID=UPI00280B33F0|nr:polysaccharide deacetylase family protein [Streptomyces sp. VNUA74]WML79179.1 polysaccharide deacetylase family protein [Streptomyces sp. VNUA74]